MAARVFEVSLKGIDSVRAARRAQNGHFPWAQDEQPQVAEPSVGNPSICQGRGGQGDGARVGGGSGSPGTQIRADSVPQDTGRPRNHGQDSSQKSLLRPGMIYSPEEPGWGIDRGQGRAGSRGEGAAMQGCRSRGSDADGRENTRENTRG